MYCGFSKPDPSYSPISSMPSASLGVGDARQRLPHDPGQLQRRVDIADSLVEQRLDGAKHGDVGVGVDDGIVGHVGETERSPESLRQRQVDVGQLGDLQPVVAAQTEPKGQLDGQRVELAVAAGAGALDDVVGDPLIAQELFDRHRYLVW